MGQRWHPEGGHPARGGHPHLGPRARALGWGFLGSSLKKQHPVVRWRVLPGQGTRQEPGGHRGPRAPPCPSTQRCSQGPRTAGEGDRNW